MCGVKHKNYNRSRQTRERNDYSNAGWTKTKHTRIYCPTVPYAFEHHILRILFLLLYERCFYFAFVCLQAIKTFTFIHCGCLDDDDLTNLFFIFFPTLSFQLGACQRGFALSQCELSAINNPQPQNAIEPEGQQHKKDTHTRLHFTNEARLYGRAAPLSASRNNPIDRGVSVNVPHVNAASTHTHTHRKQSVRIDNLLTT